MNRFDPEQITFFAKTDARGQQVPFGIKAKDRTRHVYVIGKTGMGKSTLLENMAVQDIKNGNGLAFIDPHGQTAETLLTYIPEERINDVLYFAPFDTDYPISFNVMEDVGPDRRHLVVSGLMSVFKKIWVDAWSARMEYILSNTLLALLEYPNSTLLGVNRMLSDKGYRKKVIDNISDPAVKSFWVDEFLNYNERYMQEAGDAIKNKIGQFTSNPLIRNIVGQPKSSFDIRKIMDDKKIIIMNLSKGLVGESNANLLGSMLTTRLYLAAMSRADLTQEQMKEMPNFYFFVDEFQSFANATFADILSEARKYKLNLTIAHQYIEQMEEEVRNAVFGNVGTTISFRVGPFDAEVLESVFTPKFLAPDIVNLGFAQIYLTLMIDGIGSHPFSAITLPPIEPPRVSHRDTVVANSRKNYAHPRSAVEAMINAWHSEEHNEPKKKPDAGAKKPNSYSGNNSTGGSRESSGASSNSSANNKPRPENNQNRKPQGDRLREPETRSSNPKPDHEKSAEDLRAILRSIAANAVPKEANKPETENREHKKREPETGRPDRESKRDDQRGQRDGQPQREKQREHERRNEKPSDEKKPGDGVTLKSALAEALAGVEHNAPKNEAVQPVAQAPQVQAVQASVAPTAPPSAPTVTPSSVTNDKPEGSATPVAPVTQFAKKDDDPLSPKKLERMMRVTGSDRAPLA